MWAKTSWEKILETLIIEANLKKERDSITKKLLYNKGNHHQSEEIANRMGEHAADRELISGICKEVEKLNRKKKNPAQKWEKSMNWQ